MTISSQQFQYLQEMGITLYVPRADQKQSQASDFKKLDDDVINQQMLTDILKAIGLTVGEVGVQADHLSLDTLNWYFSDKDDITLQESQLVTPEITTIGKHPQLKKQLWQALSNHFALQTSN